MDKVILLVLSVFLLVYPTTIAAQPITFDNQKVVYDLPHPGILPDNPFYFLKAIRDRILEFTTRDPLAKAELYLSYSDKRAQMASDLAQKGKNSLAITTISKGEKYFLKIPQILTDAQKQGIKPNNDFKYKLQLSNLKHREMIETLLKELPQGETTSLTDVLELNKTIGQQLERL